MRLTTRATLLIPLASLVFATAGCDRLGGSDASTPELPTRVVAFPTPLAREGEGSADDAGAEAGSGSEAVIAAPVATGVPISATLAAVAFDEGIDARPGPWSPDGQAMVAFVTVGENAAGEPVGRVWTVDTSNPSDAPDPSYPFDPEALTPLWDSGDVQDVLSRAPDLAAWSADGVLVLPRSDGMRVAPDGARDADVEGIDGQPRVVSLAPDGRTVLAVGPEGTWLVDGSGMVRAVQGAEGPFDSWSWRPDSAALALARRGGDYFTLELGTGAVEKLAESPGPGSDPFPPPRWLADGRVLLSAAGSGAGGILDHRIVDPDGGRSVSLAAQLGLEPSRGMYEDASSWVSPDGAWIVYPELVPTDDDWQFAHVASWLYDVRHGEATPLPPVAPDLMWSPDSAAFVYVDGDGTVVWDVARGRGQRLAGADGLDARPVRWSPDGRWLVLADEVDALWITAADSSTAPERLLERVDWAIAPTWSPEGDRFAAAVVDDEGQRQLVVVRVGIEDGP